MKRFFKQFIYGIFYLAVFGSIGFGIYSLFLTVSPATCFDGIKNQSEEDVDCGGDIAAGCVPCELKKLRQDGLKHSKPQIIAIGETISSVVIEIENPSKNYGLKKFSYQIEVAHKLGSNISLVGGSASLKPGEKKYIVAPGLEFSSDIIGGAVLKINNGSLDWLSAKDFTEDDQISVENKRISESAAGVAVEGDIVLAGPVKKLLLIAFGFGADEAISKVSLTTLQNVQPGRQSFKIFLPKEKYGRIDIVHDIVPE